MCEYQILVSQRTRHETSLGRGVRCAIMLRDSIIPLYQYRVIVALHLHYYIIFGFNCDSNLIIKQRGIATKRKKKGEKKQNGMNRKYWKLVIISHDYIGLVFA